ncbi:Hypothetical predicted protein [Mytilus galloprovincialis]|uniref:Carboxylesterase type B domain-containing protein n=1 Tax=Mytilus galloprovincialis TaxID=29158 RepID=A0A8B6HR69_MYTGA|nr:Hypothetical predicted protein [Mytilus galloprovincialis]
MNSVEFRLGTHQGPLRFKKPEPVDKWTDTLDATEFGAACPQSVPDMMLDFKPSKMSEDCLFLNKIASYGVDNGGGLVMAFPTSTMEDGCHTRRCDSSDLNYRLDIFGFFTVDHPASKGNYGLWDQKLALQWVHDNIASLEGILSLLQYLENQRGMECIFSIIDTAE